MNLIYNKITIGLIIILATGALLNTPLQILSISFGIMAIFLFGVLFFKTLCIERKSIVTPFPKNYLVALFVIPLIAAFLANRVFHQSILSGLLSNLNYFYFLVILYIAKFYSKVDQANIIIERIVVTLGIISLILLSFIKIIYSDLTITVPSFDGATEYSYSVYSLSSPFIVWVGFIYLAKFSERSKIRHLTLSLSFLSFPIFFYNARSYTIILLICLILFFRNVFNRKSKAIFSIAIIFFVILAVLTLSLQDRNSAFLSNKYKLFTDAFSATKGKEVNDISANARLIEAKIAYDFIQHHYLLGVGTLKTSTQKDYIPEYFYPSDIGFIGIIFNYGIIGLAIFLYQIKIFLKHSKHTLIKHDYFIVGTSYYLMSIYLSALFTGSIVYSIGTTFLLLGIIIYGKKKSSNTPDYDRDSANKL